MKGEEEGEEDKLIEGEATEDAEEEVAEDEAEAEWASYSAGGR
jgi:hypothetical protein